MEITLRINGRNNKNVPDTFLVSKENNFVTIGKDGRSKVTVDYNELCQALNMLDAETVENEDES